MTIASAVSKVTLNGDGVQTDWPFSFKVWKAADLEVAITNADGDVTVVSNWTVSLVGQGGTVTYPTSGAALASGSKITIRRSMDFLQGVDLVSGTRWDPEVVETALDQATAERQQLKEEVDRSIKLDVSDTMTPEALLDSIFEARDTAVDNAASALDSAERAEIASSTMAYYNHEGTLLSGQDTITLPWAYDLEVGVEVFLAGVKQTESSLVFTDAYTVTLDTPVTANTAFEVVASAGARGDFPAVLASPSGASLVGYGPLDVQEFLDNLGVTNDVSKGAALIGFKGRNVFEKLGDFVTPEDFGAVGDGVADDTIPLQDCVDAAGAGGSIYLHNKYRITSKITVANRGVSFIGSSTDAYGGISVIQLDAASVDNQLLDFQNAGCAFWNIIFRGKGKAVSGSQIFTTARADNVADIDLEFHNCTFFDTKTVGTLTGRGLYITDSTISTFIHGIILNWPSSLQEGGNTDQKLNTGFRSIRFSNNRVHAGSAGYLFWNTNTNHDKIWGVQITDNYIDTDCGIWRGTLKDAVVSGNMHFNNNTVPFLVQAGFFVEDVSISSNYFNGMSDDGYGNTKQYANLITADIAKRLTISGNIVKRTTADCIVLVTAASENIVVSDNVFQDVLINHRNPAVRYVLKLNISGIKGVTFTGNTITTSSLADAARVAGDVLVYSPGTAPNFVINGNQYSAGWKQTNVVPVANKRNDVATQIYDGNGAAEKVIDLDFYPSVVIVNAITGASAGATRLQLYGSATGTTEVELRNGAVAVKGVYNLSGARYMLLALP